MELRIADTFTDSLSHLTGDEQKAVKMTAFDLQLNPANPGFSFHKLDKAKDKNFWSVRVNNDIRLIVHHAASGVASCKYTFAKPVGEWRKEKGRESFLNTKPSSTLGMLAGRSKIE
jgi:mRNA-degrading endonuclease RelE of RelBE toxin-antitoxin system